MDNPPPLPTSSNHDRLIKDSKCNMQIKQTKNCLIGLSAIVLTSCTSTNQIKQQDRYDSGNGTNTSIIKVLNRVSCKESVSYCPQDYINKIWQSCLDDDYTTSPPTQKVISSRTLRELTSNNIKVTRTEPKYNTDENGIVSQSEDEATTTQVNENIEGYCIGSEYIVQ